VLDVDGFQEQHIGKISINRFYNYNTLINRSFMPSRFNAFIKRCFDIVISVVLLIILLPFICVIALLIKINDGGSVFYTQKRTGYNGKVFNILKFRSMQENAEKEGVQWAVAEDTRVTKIGRFIRKTRIDEIPQLINILKNDMSIVGPRPERPEFVAELDKNILYYNERHRIKPGLTGWAQINAGYAASIDETLEKLEYDLYYLKYFNPSFDLLIVLRTISVVLFPSNKVH
jgi:exopolysaccharide biosynthesis polyprenyl glycosylphosphotransferase